MGLMKVFDLFLLKLWQLIHRSKNMLSDQYIIFPKLEKILYKFLPFHDFLLLILLRQPILCKVELILSFEFVFLFLHVKQAPLMNKLFTATNEVGNEAKAAEVAMNFNGSLSYFLSLNWLKNLFKYWYEKNIADAWNPIPISGDTVPKYKMLYLYIMKQDLLI